MWVATAIDHPSSQDGMESITTFTNNSSRSREDTILQRCHCYVLQAPLRATCILRCTHCSDLRRGDVTLRHSVAEPGHNMALFSDSAAVCSVAAFFTSDTYLIYVIAVAELLHTVSCPSNLNESADYAEDPQSGHQAAVTSLCRV